MKAINQLLKSFRDLFEKDRDAETDLALLQDQKEDEILCKLFHA